ncbi:MAG: L,D-transpeptidase [Thermoleophilia bacterium]
MVPHPGVRTVSPTSTITIRFSAALAKGTHLPTLTPAVPGSWKIVDSSVLVFRPSGHLPVYTTVHVTVGAGTDGVRAADGGTIVAKYVASFSVGGPVSLLRAQQLLAELGYLPLRLQHFVREPANTDLISLQPLHISLVWRYRHIPRLLAAQWKPGRNTVLVKGAVMTFEADHHLAADGVLGRQVWTALLAATARHQLSRHTYNFVEVSMAMPESLSLWQDGRIIYRTRVNTGIAAAPTARGMFPVYARFRSVTMSGRLPNGAQYDDPGVPYVAYFNGGDAVHGFLRPAYGYPQSLGCVELPYAAAAVVFRYDPIGTLVCVF